ncbi:hypothetical protein ABH924_003618 [Arthrobacter sp. GAS37]|uniref:hypothetical protein n=1 Tax=Arthrobacter sp. GAS37 TaxID=3156261 RepID=UPI0038382346
MNQERKTGVFMDWVVIVGVIQAAGSIGTFVALFFIVQSTTHSRTMADSARTGLEEERERHAQAKETERRSQASQVFSWPAMLTDGAARHWGVVIENNSDAPVFGLTVQRPAGVSQSKGTPIEAISATVSVLPPGVYFFSKREPFPEPVFNRENLKPIVKNPKYMALLMFQDSTSAPWVRDQSGVLKRAT